MARIYANENFPQPVVTILRELGHDVLTTLDSGKSGERVTDEDVLEFAIESNRIVITFNCKHFIRLHHERPNFWELLFVPSIQTPTRLHSESMRR